jgi:predicted DNA-binding transcriptional regulator AlpA
MSVQLVPPALAGLDGLPAFVRRRQLADALGISIHTVSEWVRQGVLPPPLTPSKRTHLWDREQVRTALARRQQPQDAEGAGHAS